MAVAFVGVFGAGFLFFDGCGKIERGIRAVLGTWDMWDSQSISPYELPLQRSPNEQPQAFIPVMESGQDARGSGESSFTSASMHIQAMPIEARNQKAASAYRRYCHHCHGLNGDGRSIVGESYAFALPDLRIWNIQNKLDQELFDFVSYGGKRMLPLAQTATALERLLAILHLDNLKDRPSVPVFPQRWVQPAERPGGP